jgi:peptide/nickel transport system substrate-binding protein
MGSPLDPNAQLLQAIAGYLRAVGINMQVSQNTTTFIPTMLQGQTPAFFENWTITSFAYYNFAQTGGPSAFWNPRHVIDRTMVKDMTKLLHTQGPAQRKLYTKSAVDFAKAAWYIAPVVLSNTSAFNSSKLKFAMTVGAPAPYLYNFQRA